MENVIFNDITKNLVTVLPENWEKVCLYCQITNDSYEFFFHVKVDGIYIQSFDLEKSYKISRKELRDLEKNGKFSTEYEYTDYSENSLEYKKAWKEKYLK